MLRLIAAVLCCPSISFAQALFELNGLETTFLKRNISGQAVRLILSQAQIMNSAQIELSLGQGVTIKAVFRKKSVSNDRDLWLGSVVNDPFGRVVIAANPKDESDIAAEIMTGGRSYSLMQTFAGPALIETRALTENDIAISPPAGQLQTKSVQITTKSADQFVDVLLAYTDAVVAFNPNAATVLTARMAAVNGILEDSCASFRYRMVKLQQVTYAESGDFSTDLSCLYAPADGCLDSLQTLRDSTGADLMQLVLYQNSACGLAHTNSIGNFYDIKAASVVAILCGPDTMAHEMAHNMGILHDRYQMNIPADEASAQYGTGYGFVDLANKHYDIMGYPNHCQSLGYTCTRSYQFSSPRFQHNGVAFGIPNRSDAVSQMGQNFGFVANFRQSQSAYDAGISSSCQTSTKAKDVNCFIATAAFGSYMHPQVQFLRSFRDRILLRFSLGRAFVRAYNDWSPRHAEWLRQNPQFKIFVRAGILSLVFLLRYGLLLVLAGALALTVWLATRQPRALLILLFVSAAGLISPRGYAEFSAQSVFHEVITANPALRLQLPEGAIISAGYSLEQSSAKSSGAKVEGSRKAVPVVIGGYGLGWFLDASVTAGDKETIKNSQSGIGLIKDSVERSAYAVRTGWASETFGQFGIGFRSVKTDVESSGVSQRQYIDGGWHGTWDEFQFAASGHFVQEKGEGLASSKWVETQIAFGYALNPLDNRFLVEYSLHRIPSVLKTSNDGFTAYGEELQHRLVMELAWMESFFSQVAIYLGQNQTNKLHDYVSAYNESLAGARVGLTLLKGFVISLNYEIVQPGKKTGTNETHTEAALTASF